MSISNSNPFYIVLFLKKAKTECITDTPKPTKITRCAKILYFLFPYQNDAVENLYIITTLRYNETILLFLMLLNQMPVFKIIKRNLNFCCKCLFHLKAGLKIIH